MRRSLLLYDVQRRMDVRTYAITWRVAVREQIVPRGRQRDAIDARQRTRAPARATGFARPSGSIARHAPQRPDGARRQPREAARARVPVERDLRRFPVDVGLRAARRAA